MSPPCPAEGRRIAASPMRRLLGWFPRLLRRYEGARHIPESFEIDGRALGLNGTYSVLVPDVISMLPGSSGSIGLNLTGIAPTCSSNSQFTCIPFPYNVTVSATGLPQGVSMTYSNQSVEVAMGASVVDVASIAALSASPGTYVVLRHAAIHRLRGVRRLVGVERQGAMACPSHARRPPLFSGGNQPIIRKRNRHLSPIQ